MLSINSDKELRELFNRKAPLFQSDVSRHSENLIEIVSKSSFLVLGGAGSIGQAVVKELFGREPKKLDVIDISENNLAELVRDVRSTAGYIKGDFRTIAIDINSVEFDAFIARNGHYDYVLNLSALKHVRSERDPFTLMRMVQVNILNTIKTIEVAKNVGAKKYFCVSTDKAANPVNMMGASKRIMELFLAKLAPEMNISTARFANVAFSDGSLLHSFNQRLLKRQPIVAPNDIRRYFVTPKEAGELCVMSCVFGEGGDIFFPKLSEELDLVSFADVAKRYLSSMGFDHVECGSEDEARKKFAEIGETNVWPCFFSASDTTGEKPYEEFYVDGERLVLDRFNDIGIVQSRLEFNDARLDSFLLELGEIRNLGVWEKGDLVRLFK